MTKKCCTKVGVLQTGNSLSRTRSLLVYALVTLTFRTPHLAASRITAQARMVALLAALLFVVHPVQTQAVTYIVQRLSSLATFFYLLSLVLYVQARLFIEKSAGRGQESGESHPEDAGGRIKPALLISGSVIAAVLAMKTKEITFTLPFAALLYEASFFRGAWKKRLLYVLPLLLTTPIIPLTVLASSQSAGELLSDVSEKVRVETEIPRLHYLFTQFRVLVTYLRLLVLPINQNLDYDYPVYSSFSEPAVFLSFLLLAGLLALTLYLYFSRRLMPFGSRLAGFGFLFFFLALSVESSLIPIADLIFEHRLYLASFGMATAFATLFTLFFEKYSAGVYGKIPLFIAALIILALSVATFQRNRLWGEKISLWQDVTTKSPRKARPYINLGAALGQAGRMEEAIVALAKATRLNPNNPEPFVNLGAALASIGRLDEASRALTRAVDMEPENGDALNNLGIVLKDTGKVDAAIGVLSKAVRLQPDNARAYYNLGRAMMQAGRYAEAIHFFQEAIRIKPDYDNAVVDLAAALNRTGRFQEVMTLLMPRIARLAGRADARFHFGMAAHCLGDKPTAQRELSFLHRTHSGYAEQLKKIMQRSCEQGGEPGKTP